MACAGYDVRLVWNAKSKGRLRNPHPGRRRIELGVFGIAGAHVPAVAVLS